MEKELNNSIAILYEVEHIEVILAYFGVEKLKNGNGPMLVPIDYEIELVLRNKGIPFHSMVGYLARSSNKDRGAFASNMMRQMEAGPDFDFFKHNDISLGRVVGYSLGEYIQRVLYHLDIFEFILCQFKDTRTIYFPESSAKLSSTVGQLAKFEIRAGVDAVTFLARGRGVHIEIIPCAGTVAVEKNLRNFVRSYIRKIFIQSIKLLSGAVSLFRSRTAIKFFVSDYWWHIDSFITKMSGVEITMMERKEIQNARNYLWKYKIRFNHPDDYSTRSIKIHAEKKRQYYEEKWRELGNHPVFSEKFIWYGVNFWEVVRPAYTHLVTSFSADVVEMIEATERLYKKQKIETVILRASVSGQIHFSVLGLVAHKMGIPAIELQHGLECSEDFSISVRKNVDILASYGPLIKEELERVNSHHLSVVNIGSPRFDQYRNEIISEESKANLRAKLNIDPKLPVLLYIATDIVLGQTHDTYSMLQLFKNISSATRHIDEVQVVIKIRPGYAKENFFKNAIKEAFGKRCHIAQYENIHELISVSDIVTSSFSTVIIEAMIANKPLILVGIDKNDRILLESHFLPYEKAHALRIARSEEDLTHYVRILLSNPKESEMLVKASRLFLKENFCFDGKSAERMAGFLRALKG